MKMICLCLCFASLSAKFYSSYWWEIFAYINHLLRLNDVLWSVGKRKSLLPWGSMSFSIMFADSIDDRLEKLYKGRQPEICCRPFAHPWHRNDIKNQTLLPVQSQLTTFTLGWPRSVPTFLTLGILSFSSSHPHYHRLSFHFAVE